MNRAIEWPGYQGSVFMPDDFAGVACREPTPDDPQYRATVLLRSGHRVEVERTSELAIMRSTIQAFCDRVEEGLRAAQVQVRCFICGSPVVDTEAPVCSACAREIAERNLAEAQATAKRPVCLRCGGPKDTGFCYCVACTGAPADQEVRDE